MADANAKAEAQKIENLAKQALHESGQDAATALLAEVRVLERDPQLLAAVQRQFKEDAKKWNSLPVVSMETDKNDHVKVLDIRKSQLDLTFYSPQFESIYPESGIATRLTFGRSTMSAEHFYLERNK